MRIALPALALIGAALPTAAHADELIAGLLAHDVNTPVTSDIYERGVDLELGWRGDPIGALALLGKPQPHVFASVNSQGKTSFLAAGFSWKLGRGPVYVRPGVGIAVHTGPSLRVTRGRRSDLGSRVLFEPEISVGVRVAPRVAIEASWVHLSHAWLAGRQNPGLDMIGTRLALRF